MASVVGESPRLWRLMARELLRRARARMRAGPLYSWRYTGRTPERILIAPPDLRLADPQIALEIYYGRFPLAGHLVETSGQSPFQLNIAHRGWLRSLHGFRWLRHMRAAATDLAAANGRALVSDWIAIHGNTIKGEAWEPSVTARRIIAWLQHSSVVLQNADFAFYRAFLRSLAMQVRYLRSLVREMPLGKERLRARIALAFAALSLPAPPTALRNASRALSQELDRQILPDGGHLTRNPLTLLGLLADLLPLRQTYANQAEAPPVELINAIERMLPALRFFRHQDGSLARFNGMGATIHDRISAIMRHDETGGAPVLHAPHSGYERLHIEDTTVIADTGAPPPTEASMQAHAGCLSFELSSGRNHFVVNAGVDTFGTAEYRILSRMTAAHSTATINDSSSARFSQSKRVNRLLGTPLVEGPVVVTSERRDGKGVQGFTARHDGYLQRYGLIHERSLSLSKSGNVLDGIDRIIAEGPVRGGGNDLATIRFHIHPDIDVFEDENLRLVLNARGADRWVFTASRLQPSIDETIFFASLGGPRKSKQIVLSYNVSEHPEVRWRFMRTAIAG